ncbi:MAG: ATP-binding protein, partial [Wenzhouxiangella sp.]
QGYYKSERQEALGSTKPVPLRDTNCYSVILGVFHNAGYNKTVTLAQVFWMTESRGQPDRFYIVADKEMSVEEHFSGFGTDLKDLRKRLRQAEHVELHTSFPTYGAALRRRLGIASEQALDLFNQTVSMKSVGNLTEFVREHMLQPADTAARIDALIRHFDDLNRAHEAVLKAKKQIAALQPIVADADTHAERSLETAQLRQCRDGLSAWFANLKIKLLDDRLGELGRETARLDEKITGLKRSRTRQREREHELRQAIAENGGDRLERIQADIRRHRAEKTERRQQAERYRELAERLAFPAATDADRFRSNREAIEVAREQDEARQAEVQNERTDLEVDFRQLRQQRTDIDTELTSLKARRSNLPAAMLALREKLCTALDIPTDELPFAGELLQVRDDERDWEGAIERLMHNFALSLLVPDEHYGAVASWVDQTRLQGRLVYYRVRQTSTSRQEATHPQSLSRKLEIKTDSPLYGWLENELGQRFNHICCTDMTDFRRQQRAITRSGQIKTAGMRHEKDDRHAIDDRTRFVLGWSNENKIRALGEQRAQLEQRIQVLADRISELDDEFKRLAERLGDLGRLEMLDDFQRLDWSESAHAIAELEDEYQALQEQSDILKTLRGQLDELEQASRELEDQLDSLQARRHTAAEQIRRDTEDRETAEGELAAVDEACRAQVFERLEGLREDVLEARAVNLKSIDARQREFREWLTARIDSLDKQIRRLNDRIIQSMADFCNTWPQETREVDRNVEAAGEYRTMLERLQGDDLPRFEKRFKELLNENAIREVANFQSQLNREREQIRERIEIINRSLHEIDYERGRYIRLLAENAQDADIREFQQNLRACTEDSVTGSADAQYSEQKFMQVRAIIERFRGREGTADLDRRWTRKVTDVRNWFAFSASERWREDDSEHEHYADSGGKSGGQKEKLAYTVLAASLAYQFGLEWGEKRSRSFRFVVIDEAFGRGSDESARYGLELFGRLNLQLLIVTPMQKIHIIEPFVASVGFVHNPEGRQSLLRNLTIKEYRAEKAAKAARDLATPIATP